MSGRVSIQQATSPGGRLPLRLLAQLAWRNLGRHRRRNGMLLGAIALAVAGVLLLNTMLRGMDAKSARWCWTISPGM